jgi:hypothetical protein
VKLFSCKSGKTWFTAEDAEGRGGNLENGGSVVPLKTVDFTTEAPLDPSTKLRMVSLSNHKLGAGGGHGENLKSDGETTVPVKAVINPPQGTRGYTGEEQTLTLERET